MAGLSLRIGTLTTVASFASLLAFTEYVFALQPLASADASAYDYLGVFDFLQTPLASIPLSRTPIPQHEREWLRSHSPPEDST